MHPCVFILTVDRTKNTYKRALRQFKQAAAQQQFQLKKSQFMCDFEQGAKYNTFKIVVYIKI